MKEEFLVRDLGEQGLLARLERFCPAGVIGDDGAILASAPHKSLVVTTDVLVDGVHFSDRTTAPYDVGWRSAAANLSDLAAMGASALGITVGLALPGDKSVAWVEEVYRGIADSLGVYQAAIVGGDICRSGVTSLAITALGEVDPQRAIRRSAAQPGYAIVVTGQHGLSRGGLELLLDPSKGSNLTTAAREKMISAHQRPQPRLDVLPYLAEIPPEIALAGMDSSDGLADAIEQICRCSGVGAEIAAPQLTICEGLKKLAGDDTAWDWVLYGGEDFELVLCLPLELAQNFVTQLGSEAEIIGQIVSGSQIQLMNDVLVVKTLNANQKFQHF